MRIWVREWGAGCIWFFFIIKPQMHVRFFRLRYDLQIGQFLMDLQADHLPQICITPCIYKNLGDALQLTGISIFDYLVLSLHSSSYCAYEQKYQRSFDLTHMLTPQQVGGLTGYQLILP